MKFANAQTASFDEFVVDFNPQTAAYNRLIPGLNEVNVVSSTGYDKNHHRLFFLARMNMQWWHFYAVDVLTGTIVTQNMTYAPLGNPTTCHEYDNSTDTLYALHADGTTIPATYEFCWIDPATGAISDRVQVPNLSYSSGYNSAFDEVTHQFYFTGTDTNNVQRFYVIDAWSGNVLNSYPCSYYINDLCFDGVARHLYAIVDSATWSAGYVDSIDVTTGAFHPVVSIGVRSSPGRNTSTLDESNGMLYFAGRTNLTPPNYTDSLYAVDLQQQAIVNAVFYPYDPQGSSMMENVLGWHYDTTMNRIYAIHWGVITPEGIAGTAKASAMIFPAPCHDKVSVLFDQQYNSITSTLFDMDGKAILSSNQEDASEVELDVNALSPGMYFLQCCCDGNILRRKVIVE